LAFSMIDPAGWISRTLSGDALDIGMIDYYQFPRRSDGAPERDKGWCG
jgi:hypothetical protein